MGAETFTHRASGASAQAAFNDAQSEARYDHGHAGYTGTIAEKDSFVMIAAPADMTPAAYADQLLMDDDPRISDKWGPAGCIDLGDGQYLFFGWASS